jgi:hypothetical protein
MRTEGSVIAVFSFSQTVSGRLTLLSKTHFCPFCQLLDDFLLHCSGSTTSLRITWDAQLQEQLHLSKHYAKSTQGLMTRLAAKVTAHSVGMMVNSFLGRSVLKLAELAV